MILKILLENILIITAETFWLASDVSQLIKLIRTRNPHGLFAPNMVLNASGNVAWMTYFASRHLWVPLSTNAGMFIVTALTLAYLLADKRLYLKALTSIVLIAPFAAAAIIRYPHSAGWIGMGLNTIAATPWLYHIVTTKRTSGLSEHGLYFAFGAMFCTLTYGIMIGSAPLIAGCVQGLTYNLIIARFYFAYRKTH